MVVWIRNEAVPPQIRGDFASNIFYINGAQGFLFENPQDLYALLPAAEGVEHVATSLDGIFEAIMPAVQTATVTPPLVPPATPATPAQPPAFALRCGEWGSRCSFESFSTIVAKHIKSDCTLSNPDGYRMEPGPNDPDFNIFVWSAPPNVGDFPPDGEVPDKLFGIPNRIMDPPFLPIDREGYILLKSTEGVPVAQMTDRAAWILGDYVEKGDRDTLAIFEKIIELIGAELRSPKMASFIEAKIKRERELSISNLANLIQTLSMKTYKAKQDAMVRIRAEYAKKVKELTELLGEMEEAKTYVGLFDVEACRKTAATQSSLLYGSPYVKSLTLHDRDVLVTTRPLHYKDKRTGLTHELGVMDISISTTGEIKIFNKSRQIKGYSPHMNAPHVFVDGHACWGDMGIEFAELMAKLDFAGAFDRVIMFLTLGVNPDDAAGAHAHKWPIVKEDGTLMDWRDLPDDIKNKLPI